MSHYVWAALIGLIGGISSGLLGIGGGIIMVPAMVFLLEVPMKTAVGTSLAVIVPTALVGSYYHFQEGNLAWQLALSLAPMALLGGWTGAWLTTLLTTVHLKRIFGLLLVAVGIRMIFFK